MYRGKISRTLPLKERKVKDRNGKDSLAEFEKLDKELKGVKTFVFIVLYSLSLNNPASWIPVNHTIW